MQLRLSCLTSRSIISTGSSTTLSLSSSQISFIGMTRDLVYLRHDKLQTLIAGCFPWLGDLVWKVAYRWLAVPSAVLCWGGSISSDSFLPSILLLVVIVVTIVIVLVVVVVAIVRVVIVVVIIGVVVVIIGVVVVVVVGSGVPSIIKISFVIVGYFSCYRSSDCPGVSIKYNGNFLEFKTSRDRYGNNGMSDSIGNLVFLDTKVLRKSDGEIDSEDKRSFVKLSKESGEMFPGVTGNSLVEDNYHGEHYYCIQAHDTNTLTGKITIVTLVGEQCPRGKGNLINGKSISKERRLYGSTALSTRAERAGMKIIEPGFEAYSLERSKSGLLHLTILELLEQRDCSYEGL
ncbi:hypothetical protein Tco_1483847 [Tanacetum coccineum]